MSKLSLGSLRLPTVQDINPEDYSVRRFSAKGRVLDGGRQPQGLGSRIQQSGNMSQYQQLQLLRALQNDAYEKNLSERKFEYEILKGERDWALKLDKEKFDRSRNVFDQFVNAYTKASDNPALQTHLADSAKGFLGGLSPAHQQLMAPYVNNSPFSLKKQNLEMWEKMNPMPQVVSDPTENPYGFANEVVSQEDWKAMRSTFINGKAPPKRQLIPMGEGLYVQRDDNGIHAITSEEKLQIKQLAEENGMKPGELIANDGWVSGKSTRVKTSKGIYDLTPQHNVVSGKNKVQESFVKDLPLERMSAQKTKLYDDFLINFAAGDSKSNSSGAILARQVKELLKGGTPNDEARAQMLLSSAFPEMTFALVPEGKELPWYGQMIEAMIPGGEASFVAPHGKQLIMPSFNVAKKLIPWLENLDPSKMHFFESKGTDYTVRSMFGQPTMFVDPVTNKELGIYVYDEAEDMVYNKSGIPLGSYEQVIEELRKRSAK